MADNRKYYYLKLKENFFDSDSIVLLPKARLPRNRAYPIIHARRARAYEKRN